MPTPTQLARQRLRAAGAADRNRVSSSPRPRGGRDEREPREGPPPGTIEVRCPCGKRYRLPDSAAGKRLRCKGCGETVDVFAVEAEGGAERERGPDRAEQVERGAPARAGGARRRSDREDRSGSGSDERAPARRASAEGKGLRIAALVLGLLGAAASGLLGAAWLKDYNDNQAAMQLVVGLRDFAAKMGGDTKKLDAEIAKLEDMRTAAFFLVGALPLGIGGGVLAWKRRTKIGGAVLIAAAVAPAVLAPKSLGFTWLLVVGGILALSAPTGGRRS
jgi:hypothetical protein